jgi:hypothetical protein
MLSANNLPAANHDVAPADALTFRALPRFVEVVTTNASSGLSR